MTNRQSEKAAKNGDQERALLCNLIAALPDAIFFLDLASSFQGCNPVFEQLFGLDAADLVQRKPEEIFDPATARSMQQQIDAVLQSGQPRQFEHLIETPRLFLIETHIRPYCSGQGHMIWLICHSRDISAQQNLKMDLEAERQRLQRVIFAANIGVWELLVTTGEMALNDYSAGLLGYDLAELAPLSFQTWTALYHPADAARAQRLLEKYLAGEANYYDCECRLRHKDGHWVWVHSRGSVVEWTPDLRPQRLSGTHTDITARKEAEEQLRLANETLEQRVRERTQTLQETHSKMVLQEKMASLGQLAAGIAHEINNPIHFIRINNATLSQDFADLQEILQNYRSLIADLETAGRRAADLTALRAKEATLQLDDLLKDIPELFAESERGFDRIGRIIQSMRTFSHQPFQNHRRFADINQGIEDTLVLTKNNYKYYAEISKDLGELPGICCEPEQLNQVFLNLIVNSSQAIASQNRPEKGRIAIRTWYAAGVVYCEISDNGPGIPADIRSRIFEPFFSTKGPGQGTGLGLSISYDIIVNKHHGDLAVHCPEAGGTVFTIRIPANLPTSRADAPSRQ